MREIALFAEDYAHQLVIGALVSRVAGEYNIDVHLGLAERSRRLRESHYRIQQLYT